MKGNIIYEVVLEFGKGLNIAASTSSKGSRDIEKP